MERAKAPARPTERVTKPHTLEDRTRRRHCLSGPSPLPGGAGDGGPTHKPRLRGSNDARTGMPPGIPGGAMCVQRFDDSLNSAIHITYRISLRSSSMPEPRDPLLKVLTDLVCLLRQQSFSKTAFEKMSPAGPRGPRRSNRRYNNHGWEVGSHEGDPHSVMILPQVHLRKPCYDFSFL